MEWEIFIHKKEGYIEVITSGNADKEGSLAMAKEISKSMAHNRITKVLIDHRKISSVSGAALEIYERPKILKLIGALLKIKIAEIINPIHRDHFHFLETVCINQGYNFSIFEEKDIAINWLMK